MSWFLSPSGWPTYADTADEAATLTAGGYDPLADDQVSAAVAAYRAAQTAPPPSSLPGYALAADVAAALATKADASALAAKVNSSTYTTGLAGKADLAAGKVPDTQIPARLQDTALRAALVPFWTAGETVTANKIRMAPDGHTIQRIADGTARSSYDATEQALWTVVTAGSGITLPQAAGVAAGMTLIFGG